MSLKIGINNKAKNISKVYIQLSSNKTPKEINKIYLGDENNKAKLVYQRYIIDYNRYFKYTIDTANEICIITAVIWDNWYNDYKNYDIIIPNKIEGYLVVIE
jgi:hypothetical protein